MPRDELKARTVCLKLAKSCSSLYLYDNSPDLKIRHKGVGSTEPPDVVAKPSTERNQSQNRHVHQKITKNQFSSDMKQFQNQNVLKRMAKNQFSSERKGERVLEKFSKNKFNSEVKDSENETVLQKFIRGFDCCETCDDRLSGVNPPRVYGCCADRNSCAPVENTSILKKPFCRVEFISPVKTDESTGERSTPVRPLIVDLSQNKMNSDYYQNISTSSNKISRGLNESFIMPKVRVENFSCTSGSSNLSLVFSPVESSKCHDNSQFAGSSTKVEIDYTGSAFHNSCQIEYDSTRRTNSESFEMCKHNTMSGGRQGSLCEVKRNHGLPRSDKNRQTQALVNILLEGVNSAEKDVLRAAEALYSKRTRTLFHWINPRIPKTKLKDSVTTSWQLLPSWQKQIYISQVLGKYSSNALSPMINPQILHLNGLTETNSQTGRTNGAVAELALDNQLEVRKKRKYTRRTSVVTSTRTRVTNQRTNSLHHFLANL